MNKPKCARCGRPLKDPVSIAAGMGPECRQTAARIRRAAQKAQHGEEQGGQAAGGKAGGPAGRQVCALCKKPMAGEQVYHKKYCLKCAQLMGLKI